MAHEGRQHEITRGVGYAVRNAGSECLPHLSELSISLDCTLAVPLGTVLLPLTKSQVSTVLEIRWMVVLPSGWDPLSGEKCTVSWMILVRVLDPS